MSAVLTMTLEQLRITFNAGGLSRAQVVATDNRFHVEIYTKSGDRVILVRHSDATPRAFSDPATALKLLCEIGFCVVAVDMSHWQKAHHTR